MRAPRLLVALAAAALLGPLGATTASAAPTNDTSAGATAVTSLPTTVTQDTSTATTDALDATLNEQCGAPATNGSVWFTYTDPTGDGLLVDLAQSDFTAGVMIVQGDPTAGGFLVACGPEAVAVRGEAGTTYYVMAFSDTPERIGGTLVASFEPLPPAPVSTLTVDPRATAYKDGSLKLTGSYSCSNANGFFSDIEGQVVQRVGRVKIAGFFFTSPLECDGAVHPWEAFAFSDNGLFAGGKAANVSIVFACGDFDCATTAVEQSVQVSRNGK
ncbi:hypothetical protein GCM10009721_33560 [Terrabacter tumescens]|uniref:DUF6299 domain-containing protein n=1 Tax=Terrabacter tumescens TaxID=60443 RepID=A0ABQ2IAU3_9MICO|nr:DUF6299 family protein [Terrabacter tumescens]GGN03535.1 hypothetical protein GCM10009721_33560 [Terrabacter tumescens]